MSYALTVKRDIFTENCTGGKLYIDGVFFGYTMEDVSRGENVKIYGKTCIPTGNYKVNVTKSARFDREMPIIYTEPNGYEIQNKGIEFKGVRFHGGNTHLDSLGCILICRNRIHDELIQGSLEKELTAKLIAKGVKGTLEVINSPTSV